MIKRISILIILLSFMLTLSIYAQEAVLLEYKPKPGTTVKYQMNIRGSTVVTAMQKAQKTDLETIMKVEQKVTGVDKNGNIEMTTTILEGTITVNNTPTPLPAVGQIIRVKMAKDGEILESEGMDQGNFNQMQVRFPNKPVKVGDSWNSEIQPNPQLPIPLKVKYTLVGFEKVDGYDCAVLQSNVTSDQGQAGSINLNVKADGKIWFAYKEGIMVKNEVTSNMVMVMESDMGGGKKEKIDTRMNLVLKMGIAK